MRSWLLAALALAAATPAAARAQHAAASAPHVARAHAPADGPNVFGDAGGFLVVRKGEGKWRPTDDAGVTFKLLYADRERGTVTTLVRMEPGSRIRSHRHLGVEQCLVLEGDVRSGPVGMTAGDFNCSMPGSVHEELVSDGGALLLLVSPERYEPIEPHAV
jgi:quercetin dioxygenase-like cupin family protein